LLALALAGGLEQPEHGFGDIWIADEDALDGPRLLHRGGTGQREIGGIGIDHMAVGVGDGDAVEGAVGDGAHDRIFGCAIGEADDAGRESEQHEQADHGQQCQQRQNVGLRLGAAEGHEGDGTADDHRCNQQDKDDAATAAHGLLACLGLRQRDLAIVVGVDAHRTGYSLSVVVAARSRALPECPNRPGARKRFRRCFALNWPILTVFPPGPRIMTDDRTGRA
jgi:hypothetical protein